MYPRVGSLPIAAVNAAMGLGGAAPASPRPPRPAPPRPPRPAPPRTPAAAGGLGPAPVGRPGAAGFKAATRGLRSSSVDHRTIRTLTGLPDSLTFADVALRSTSPDCACVGVG